LNEKVWRKATADSSLATPKLKKALADPCAQNDSHSVGVKLSIESAAPSAETAYRDSNPY